MPSQRKLLRIVLTLVILAIAWGVKEWRAREGQGGDPSGEATTREVAGDGVEAIVAAARAGRSLHIVEAEGTVATVLADDLEGSRHQRFIVRLAGGHTVLIAHNIDLAPRAPVNKGDDVRFKGEYEPNEKGGVIHWTHHDPKRRREGGWLRVAGKTYE